MKCLQVNPNNIVEILEKIEQSISSLDDVLKFKIMLICEETITNQIRHADFKNRIKDIEFCIDLSDIDNIILVFKDNAQKFNLLEKHNPDLTTSIEETNLGGLGIFMIKKYSKKLTYSYKNGYNLLKVLL